jgi:NUMOD3 motif
MKNLIYTLSDPTTHEVRYVGLSTRGMVRPRAHLSPSVLTRETHKNHWLRALVAKGKRPIIAVVAAWDSIAFEELCGAERYWIRYFRDNGSPLTNATDGGEGTVNPPPDIRAKNGSARRGVRLSLELRARMSASRRGRPLSEEHRRRIGEGNMGHQTSDATRAKIGAANKGRKLSAEHRAKLSAASSASLKGRPVTPETRAKIGAANKAARARAATNYGAADAS